MREQNHSNIETYGGKWFDFNAPDPATVDITDIAKALSRLCRYSGNCSRFYSVGEHSCLCSGIAHLDGHDMRVRLACLLHDTPEAYTADIPGPVKKYLLQYTNALSELEDRIYDVILEGLGLAGCLFGLDDIVHEIDQKAFAYEELYLMNSRGEWLPDDWPGKGNDYDIVSIGYTPNTAYRTFLDNYEYFREELKI